MVQCCGFKLGRLLKRVDTISHSTLLLEKRQQEKSGRGHLHPAHICISFSLIPRSISFRNRIRVAGNHISRGHRRWSSSLHYLEWNCESRFGWMYYYFARPAAARLQIFPRNLALSFPFLCLIRHCVQTFRKLGLGAEIKFVSLVVFQNVRLHGSVRDELKYNVMMERIITSTTHGRRY